MNEIRPNLIRAADNSTTASRLMQLLALLTILNWFALFAVSSYLHGDALGTLPSKDGFIVKSHGHHTTVSESTWLFSLFYSGFTILGTPAFWIIYGSVAALRGPNRPSLGKGIFIAVFIILWSSLWFPAIGGDLRRSYKDWQNLKHSKTDPITVPATPPNLPHP